MYEFWVDKKFHPIAHKFLVWHLFIIIQLVSPLIVISSLTHDLFRSILLHFRTFEYFLITLLPISSLIPVKLWLENIFCMISVLWNLLKFVLWLDICLIFWQMFTCTWKGSVFVLSLLGSGSHCVLLRSNFLLHSSILLNPYWLFAACSIVTERGVY